MANAALHGNGKPCPDCKGQRDIHRWPKCSKCKGTGRIAKTKSQIIADSVKWARKHYWPDKANTEHRSRAGL